MSIFFQVVLPCCHSDLCHINNDVIISVIHNIFEDIAFYFYETLYEILFECLKKYQGIRVP